MERDIFALDRFVARRNFFNFLGATFTIRDPEYGEVLAYIRQKAFKLKEDIRVYADDSKSEELLLIKARNVIDFSAAYDITVAKTGEKVGALRRKGFSSIVRDRWQILDADDNQIGEMYEDSTGLALLRRFLSNLIPQRFHIEVGGRSVGHVRQFFNPFVLKHDVDLTGDTDRQLDRRLAVGGVILLLAIEGRQN